MTLAKPTTSRALPKDVAKAFEAQPVKERAKLLLVRDLIFETAERTPGVGALTETLKWGEPAYLTEETKSGSTIRLGVPRGREQTCALYFICSTSLVDSFRSQFADDLTFDGDRAILLDTSKRLPKRALRACISMALTYHQNKH